MTRVRLLLILVAGVTLLPSSAGGAVQWYEHYEAGLSLFQEENWAEAAERFRDAARLGPRPRRRINTYGQNFLFDYDPFAYLAHCLIELGQTDDAEEALQEAERSRVTPRPRLEILRTRLDELRVRTIVGGEQEPVPMVVPKESPPADEAILPPGGEPVADVVPTPSQDAKPAVPAPAPATSPPAIPKPVETRVAVPPRAATPEPVSQTPLALGVPTAPAVTAAPQPVAERAAEPEGHDPRWSGTNWIIIVIVGGTVLAAGAFGVRVRRDRRCRVDGTGSFASILGGGATRQAGPVRLGPYSVRETLGRGGMATTYRAVRCTDSTTVALKIPHDSCLVDESFRTRFLREGELGQQLHHPNIVRIYDTGEDRGLLYLAMELLTGHILRQELRAIKRMPERRALEIVRAIAEALDYAHAKGVIHRDLKPENIMVQADGSIKVMDFGIARVAGQAGITSTNLFLGTPMYGAPESIDSRSVDHRSDLYSLGIVFFELLQGRAPFSSESPFQVMEMHLRTPLPTLESLEHPVRSSVWAIVERLCAKDRGNRHPSAAPLLVELNRALYDDQ